MAIVALVLLVALMIPIMGILVDSPIGRALARRLEGAPAPSAELADLVRKVELLEGEVDDLGRAVRDLQEENQFLQRLLEESGRTPLPPAPPSP